MWVGVAKTAGQIVPLDIRRPVHHIATLDRKDSLLEDDCFPDWLNVALGDSGTGWLVVEYSNLTELLG
jgi:hypothetical protein